MTVKLTISLDKHTEQTIKALARKRKTTVSGLVRDLVRSAAGKDKLSPTFSGGLGTQLRAQQHLLPAGEKNYKTLLGKLRDEKHLNP